MTWVYASLEIRREELIKTCRSKKPFFFFSNQVFSPFPNNFLYVLDTKKKCLFYILFSSPKPRNFWSFPLENARNQIYHGFGRAGEIWHGLLYLEHYFSNFSLNPSHCLTFKLFRKRKEKAFFSQWKYCSFWTDAVILHVQKTYGLQAAETDRRSPPAMRMRTQRQGFSSARPETESNSPSCLRATSPGCLQPKSNHIWLQAKFRKLDYLSPPSDGRRKVEEKEKGGVKN